jgi:hypothetical protein
MPSELNATLSHLYRRVWAGRMDLPTGVFAPPLLDGPANEMPDSGVRCRLIRSRLVPPTLYAVFSLSLGG